MFERSTPDGAPRQLPYGLPTQDDQTAQKRNTVSAASCNESFPLGSRRAAGVTFHG